MTHFGIICPASTGHLNTMFPIGRELQKRGHRVTLVGVLDVQSKALEAGFEFRAIAESESPVGTTAQSLAQLGELNGQAALRYTITFFTQATALLLLYAPDAIKDAGIEALLVDQTISGGGTVAEFLQIPFVTVCSAVVLNQENSVPPFFTNWSYNPAWWARLRNQVAYSQLRRIRKPIQQVINEYRQERKLPIHSHPRESYSKLAIISQQPAEFEFPRQNLPQWFHFTGPYHDFTGRPRVDFPLEKLTGQPLIYASMGTVQNRLQYIFRDIASACVGLDAQLVISLGGSASPETFSDLPGSPLVVGYAPQLKLLKKATLTITHAGLNTTLESLSNGVPMVAIPVANDQPGVAARIAWTGCGEAVPVARVNVPKLRDAIQRVLKEDSYKKNALRLQEAISRAGGVSRASDIIEQAVSTGKPVLAPTQ
ncbi:glycosyltransferase [Iningainema tapete]|uniref:Glycosyltransferase n=1 Tax=Iningainema tapete BLCC-T55 TaxID=2748662 RepID=A0A8J6XIX2_9CYAN|nr:glycosyltransferase [Iningainema tapete]MBD2777695.1 glycosyltransferase [Iningainema tapete BLCC-T55]